MTSLRLVALLSVSAGFLLWSPALLLLGGVSASFVALRYPGVSNDA